jgi:hypothetical protein
MDTILEAGFVVGALFGFVAFTLRGFLHRGVLQSVKPPPRESLDFLDTEPAMHEGL